MAHADIEKGIHRDHVATHIVSPFQDLGANISQEGIRGPTVEDHDLSGRDIIDEERHRSARTN